MTSRGLSRTEGQWCASAAPSAGRTKTATPSLTVASGATSIARGKKSSRSDTRNPSSRASRLTRIDATPNFMRPPFVKGQIGRFYANCPTAWSRRVLGSPSPYVDFLGAGIGGGTAGEEGHGAAHNDGTAAPLLQGHSILWQRLQQHPVRAHEVPDDVLRAGQG